MNLPVGHFLQNNKYQLLHVVGQGGFGITYKGILFTEVKGPLGTIKTEIPISIKEYFFKDYCYRVPGTLAVDVHSQTGKQLFDKFKEKLIKEAKILSDVHHPYIVNVLDVFEENNTAYIAMEYIPGHSLKYILEKEGIVPEQKVLKYIDQIAQALQFVHEKNILHLDIKPSNIIIDNNDNARLIDFGVSKRYDVEDKETSTTMLTLSKGFASIEQYDNEGTQTFSPCPDIYSLGATMYNLLTGKIPTESILRATRPLQNPTELNPGISPRTEDAIIKAMQINPADRFNSVLEMVESLDRPILEAESNKKTTETFTVGDNDDATVLYDALIHNNKTDNELTIVDNKQLHISPTKKKKNKGLLITALICIFAVVGSSVALLIGNDNPKVEAIELPPITSSEEEVTEFPVNADGSEKKNITDLATVAHENENPVQQLSIEEQQLTELNRDLINNNEDKPEELLPAEPDVDVLYEELLSSGKAKMNAADFVGANEDFNKAKELKLTEEIVRLSIANDEKAEESRISEKKALYEEKMSFGNYKIVRKKSTGKYGAIDDKGNERIPCIYLNVDIAEDGRAFEREDKLFDIYNVNGVLVRSDVTY